MTPPAIFAKIVVIQPTEATTVKILSIETSCDETSLAIVEAKGGKIPTDIPHFKIEKSLVASQIDIHRPLAALCRTWPNASI